MKKKIIYIYFIILSVNAYAQVSMLRDIIPVVTSGYQNGMATGSAFVVTTIDGINLIVSNYHVVNNTNRIRVIFYPNEGSARIFNSARIAGRLPEFDIAILTFNGDEKVFTQTEGIKLDLKQMDDGDRVSAAGYPSGVWSYTEGMISNRRALVRLRNYPEKEQNFLQHTSFVDHGSSGGPLLVRNQFAPPYGFSVVGINTLTSSNHNMHYSIPINRIFNLLDSVWKQYHEYHVSFTKNTMETAVEHYFFNSIYAVIQSVNDSIWYYFTIYESNEYFTELDATENILLEVFDGSGSMINVEKGKNIRLNVKANQGGLYLKISSPDVRFWTTYRLKVNPLASN